MTSPRPDESGGVATALTSRSWGLGLDGPRTRSSWRASSEAASLRSEGGPAAAPDVDDLPQVGDEIGPYALVRELGRGAFARVFLARQADLEDRLVVLKVSARVTPEPRLLARARHAHIVELLGHALVDDGAFQLLCMPFLGGASLAAVLEATRRRARRPEKGRDLLEDLDRVSAPEYPIAADHARPARQTLAGLSYARAIAWIGARLAEALDHAFRCDVIHGDVKPSNVLLTADGHPMLLDLNLAVDDRPVDRPTRAVGGTLAYMAPERLRRIADGGPTAAGPAEGHQADLYALGLTLLEALGGAPTAIPDSVDSIRDLAAALAEARGRPAAELIRRSGAAVPAGLRPILARCLAADPARRYGRAAELAADLDRWRTDRAPAFAPEPHPWTGLLRWGRRNRRALAVAGLTAVAAAASGLLVLNATQAPRRQQAEAKLAQAWDRPESGAIRSRRPDVSTPDAEPAAQALRGLTLYEVLERADWRRRDDIRALAAPDREDLEAWLLEQALRYGRALRERPESPDDWRRGLAALERAAGPAPPGAIAEECRLLRRQLGRPAGKPAAAGGAGTARWLEEYLRGVASEPDRAAEALAHYRNALRDRPGSFWAHYRAAATATRLSEFADAAAHLRACVVRRPRNAALHCLLAGALYRVDRLDEALVECARAVELEPDYAEPYRTRTFVWGRLGQGARIGADIDRFSRLTTAAGRSAPRILRFESLLARGTIPDEESLRQAVDDDPEALGARLLLASQLAEAGDEEAALPEFDKIVDRDPENLRVRFHRALVLRKLGRDEAGAELDYLVDHPRLEELIRELPPALRVFHHASAVHLEQGRIDRAVQVAERGLAEAERLGQMRGESHYALARAYAASAPAHGAEAVRLAAGQLEAAGRCHPHFLEQWYERDPIFDPIRPSLAHIAGGGLVTSR